MKSIVWIIVFWSVGFAGPNPKRVFEGKWKLDPARSKNLQSSFKGVESYVMDIRQTADSLLLFVDMQGAGQHVNFPVAAYELNGRETFRSDTLRGSKRWSTCKLSSNGKSLTITSKAEQMGMDQRFQKFRQTDSWKLVDVNTLQIDITQVYTKPDASTRKERRIFRRLP